jgi:hypothetical protein
MISQGTGKNQCATQPDGDPCSHESQAASQYTLPHIALLGSKRNADRDFVGSLVYKIEETPGLPANRLVRLKVVAIGSIEATWPRWSATSVRQSFALFLLLH